MGKKIGKGASVAFLSAFLMSGTALATSDGRGGTVVAALHGIDTPAKSKVDLLQNKVNLWINATENGANIDTATLMAFVNGNPNWPRMGVLKQKIEDNLPATLRPYEVVDWFSIHPPRSFKGIDRYAAALVQLGRTEEAQKALKNFWSEGRLQKPELYTLVGRYAKFLSMEDHAQRIDQLIWNGRYSEAEAMLSFVDKDLRALSRARLSLARNVGNVDAAIRNVPQDLQDHPGLLYERLKWRRIRNMDDRTLELLNHAAADGGNAQAWWRERHILARRAIEKRNYTLAHRIITGHKLREGSDYIQAEWTAGWIELNHLKQPQAAVKRFENLAEKATSAITRARAAYWAGRAHEELKNPSFAAHWYTQASHYASTFYGQLAAEKAGYAANAILRSETAVAAQEHEDFSKNELVRAVRLLNHKGKTELSDPFLSRLLSQATTRAQFNLVAGLATESGRLHMSIRANREMQTKLGDYMVDKGYPLLPEKLQRNKPERALVNAIVNRESMFDTTAVSPARAQGLMQLMPATARELARRQGVNLNSGDLIRDQKLNVRLGSAYLQQMLDRYDGSYLLAIAAYNAGPGNVGKWIETFGDPRKPGVDVIDWIEHIPIYETRNYVQRVMETYFIYKAKLSEKPVTILAVK